MADLTDLRFFLAGILRPIVVDAVREEFQRISSAPTPPDETGGVALAEEITGLSRPRLYALVSAREIPHSKRGNRLYFNRSELLAWIKQGSRAVEGQPK